MANMCYDKNGKPDFYSVLHVTRDANEAEIKSAFRRLSFRYHPDKKDLSSEASNENFVQLREAYETLSDPTRRQIYNKDLPQQTREECEISQKSTGRPQTSREEGTQNEDAQRDLLRKRSIYLQEQLDELWTTFDHLHRPRITKLPALYLSFMELRQVILTMKDRGARWKSKIGIIMDETRGPITDYDEIIHENLRFQTQISILHQALESICNIDDVLRIFEGPSGDDNSFWECELARRVTHFYSLRHIIDLRIVNS